MQTCAYHLGQEAYISCQRCHKPICPQCQVVAPVGFQCPSCVKAGSAHQRAATTTFGGRLADRPIATYALVGIGVLLYAAGYASPAIANLLAFSPAAGPAQPWRYLTYALAGGGALFPFIMLLALFYVGRESEQLLGRARFLTVWALSAVGGSVFLALLGSPTQALYGSAGSVLGVGAAWLLLNWRLRRRQAAAWVLVLVVVITVWSTPWPAVLGSVLAGVAASAVIAFIPNNRRQLHWAGLAGIAVLLVLLAVLGAVLTWR